MTWQNLVILRRSCIIPIQAILRWDLTGRGLEGDSFKPAFPVEVKKKLCVFSLYSAVSFLSLSLPLIPQYRSFWLWLQHGSEQGDFKIPLEQKKVETFYFSRSFTDLLPLSGGSTGKMGLFYFKKKKNNKRKLVTAEGTNAKIQQCCWCGPARQRRGGRWGGLTVCPWPCDFCGPIKTNNKQQPTHGLSKTLLCPFISRSVEGFLPCWLVTLGNRRQRKTKKKCSCYTTSRTRLAPLHMYRPSQSDF